VTRKKQIFCTIPHSAAFDSCFTLLERLQERGRILPLERAVDIYTVKDRGRAAMFATIKEG